MFSFHVKTRDFEREGRFFDGGRKLFGTTLTQLNELKKFKTLLNFSKKGFEKFSKVLNFFSSFSWVNFDKTKS